MGIVKRKKKWWQEILDIMRCLVVEWRGGVKLKRKGERDVTK
jgi:hypothetical protein